MTIKLDNVNNAMKRYADITVRLLQQELSDTINLKKNIKVVGTDDNIAIQMPSYAIYVNDGRRPGKQPPIDALRDWARERNIPEEALFPIARKIGRDGIPARNFLDLVEREEVLSQMMGEALVKDIYISLGL